MFFIFRQIPPPTSTLNHHKKRSQYHNQPSQLSIACTREEIWWGRSHNHNPPAFVSLRGKGIQSQECVSGACTQHNHLLGWDFECESPRPCLAFESFFPGDSSGLLPVFFSFLALLKITVKPSAEAGSFSSQSPNFGNGFPLSCQTT